MGRETPKVGHQVEPPSGTTTLLFSDIDGSTRLLRRLGDRYADVLHAHHELLREAFERHDGVEVGTEGDSFFVAFSRAKDGVAAAVAVQRTLAAHDWPDGGTVRVRIGLHTGEPWLTSGQYGGYDVHRAARISASAHGGQVVVSDVTRRLAEGAGGGDVGFLDLGEHRLKDLSEAEHLYQVTADGLPREFPPLRSVEAVRTNLPGQLTSFVGRGEAVSELKGLVVQHRLVTLTGTGGAGKTRLALRAAGELLPQFRDGVWLVRLAAVGDPDLVAQTIAGTIGLRSPGNGRPVEAIIDYSRDKQLLLVLDNFEHLIAAAGVVAELVERSPGVSVLVTSREVLSLRGECEMTVPPLLLPPRNDQEDIARLRQVESVRLFVDRARAVLPGFDVTEDNAAALAEIAYRLEGLPLAVELAAARVKVLSPDALANRLGDRLSVLTGGSRDLPERQRTLRATIEWSYGLLAEQERALLGRLSVFAGWVRLETVEAVCAWDDVDVLTVLTALVDKSLVRRAISDAGEVAFWMLETVKEYAGQTLRTRGEHEHLRDRHAEHYHAIALRFREQVLGPRQVEWLNITEHEQADIVAAIQWSLESDAAARAAAISEGVHLVWLIRGHYATGRHWLRRTAAACAADPVLQAKVLVASARLATDQGAFDDAEQALTQAVESGRRHGDDVVAYAVSELTWMRIQRGDEHVGEHVAEALATFRRLGDMSAEAELLLRVGSLLINQGELSEATRTYAHALSLMRRAENSWGVGIALNNMGYLAALQERFDEAMAQLEEAREIYETVGTKEGLAGVNDSLALVAAGRGDSATAVRHYETSRDLFREMNNRPGVAFEQVHLGRTRAERGEFDRAAACLFETLALVRDSQDPQLRAFALEAVGALLLRTDRYEQAAEMYAAAGRLHDEGPALAAVDLHRRERELSLLTQRMDPAALASATERGSRLTRDELYEIALSAVTPTSAGGAAPNRRGQQHPDRQPELPPFPLWTKLPSRSGLGTC